ncbi:MAG: hypothetical protein JWL80_21 [Parcubacteria group bacterium]|nr:hypothetical protein [Parcubacteria group bacterium]
MSLEQVPTTSTEGDTLITKAQYWEGLKVMFWAFLALAAPVVVMAWPMIAGGRATEVSALGQSVAKVAFVTPDKTKALFEKEDGEMLWVELPLRSFRHDEKERMEVEAGKSYRHSFKILTRWGLTQHFLTRV